MKVILVALVSIMVAGFDAAMLFFAWFTLGFFGFAPSSWLIVLAMLTIAACVTWIGKEALGRINQGKLNI